MNKIIPVLVMKPNGNRIICLSNIFDPHYHDLRGEKVERCLTTPYRRDVFRCLEMASDREIIVLSSPSRVVERRAARCSSGGMGTP